MGTNRDEQQASPDLQETEGLRIEASRRQFLQFSGAAAAAVSAAAAGALVPSAAFAENNPLTMGVSNRPSWAPTKYLIDCHCYVGSGPTVAELAPSIHTAADWGALRTKQPEKFAKAVSEGAVDDSAILLRAMDKYGVTHAIIQTAPGKGTTNQMVIDAAKNSKGRFFPIYRPEAVSNAAARGTLGVDYGDEVSKVVRQIADELQSPAMSATRGVGEIVPITTEIHPAKITRDMAPIMEVLKARGNLPIMFPTGYRLERRALLRLFSYLDGRGGRDFPDGAHRPHEDGSEYPRVLRCLSVCGHAQRQRLLRYDRHLGGTPA